MEEKAGKGIPELSLEERIELENLRQAQKNLQQKLADAGKGSKGKAAGANKEEEKKEGLFEKDSSSSDSEVGDFVTNTLSQTLT